MEKSFKEVEQLRGPELYWDAYDTGGLTTVNLSFFTFHTFADTTQGPYRKILMIAVFNTDILSSCMVWGSARDSERSEAFRKR
ncbi:hypothetical protein NC651_009808 [Populus alba x Populus x berolinensis]|nr:hypothetical protein NC651_009808 [Populus alba x Populus x berolinensis]